MKTIEEMWQEFFNNTDFTGCKVEKAMRKAFFAGFCKCYCTANQGDGYRIVSSALGDRAFLEIAQYEKEMDDHRDESDE